VYDSKELGTESEVVTCSERPKEPLPMETDQESPLSSNKSTLISHETAEPSQDEPSPKSSQDDSSKRRYVGMQL